MTGVASMAVAIIPADKSLIVVIELLLWMRRAKDVWASPAGERTEGPGSTQDMAFNAAFSIKSRFRILNWLLTCSIVGASGELIFDAMMNLMDADCVRERARMPV
jgi:hypothetical protein